ncbi:MAG: response regulator, partial [Planctomycetes bacterium]|nr:response regulator [Planctomycetota bacterium]
MSHKILIIDDEEVLRESMTCFLEDMNYKVIQAHNGLVGMELFESEGADLVMTDLRMPELDGLDVLARIQKLNSDIPLIVVSGMGQIKDSVKALQLGAWDYILKPVQDMSIITFSIEKALEKAQLIKENRNYQKNLESLVHTKTKELERSNEELMKTCKELDEHKVNLESIVEKRTIEVKKLQSRMIEEAHNSGQIDILSSIMHNMGNTLTSALVESNLVNSLARNMPLEKLKKANEMLNNNWHHM